MKIVKTLSLALGLGVTMCGSKEHPQPATQAKAPAGPAADQAALPVTAKPPEKEKNMASSRWIELSAAGGRFLIVKIADAKGRPPETFDGEESLAGKDASQTLYYVLIPHAAAAVEIARESAGKRAALPKPRMIHRMPGSALYLPFLADPARPGTLAFKLAGKEEAVPLADRVAALEHLPYFWSGDPPTVAFEEVPGWMEASGP